MTALLAALLFAAPVFAQDEAHDARVTEVKGEVTLYEAGSAEGIPAEADVPLQDGDRLVVGKGASAELAFQDGESVVYLNENSDFTVRSTRRADTIFELSLGALIAKIKTLATTDRLTIRTPTAVCAVRGTEFGVDTEGGAGHTHVGVFDEGKVEVTGDAGAPQMLQPNQETGVAKGEAPAKPFALQRLARHKLLMRSHMRARAAALHKRWKALPPEQRQEMRRKAFERMRARRMKARERMEKRRERQERRQERRRELRRNGGRRP